MSITYYTEEHVKKATEKLKAHLDFLNQQEEACKAVLAACSKMNNPAFDQTRIATQIKAYLDQANREIADEAKLKDGYGG